MKKLLLAEAAELLKPGMTAFIHGTTSEPRALVEYLAEHPHHMAGVHLITSFIPGINNIQLAGIAPGSRLTTFMAQPALHDAIASGQAEALRLPYSALAGFFAELPRLDIAFVQGRICVDHSFSTGITGELIPVACDKAETICVINNGLMATPVSGCQIPAQRADFVVDADAPLIEYITADRTDAVSEKIAANVAGLVRDGDTIQAGLGVIPGAVFALLAKHRKLRVFSGMVSDALIPLAESGALDDDAMHVYGMAMGSAQLYAWLDGRRGFEVAGVERTHDRETLRSIERFVAINSAIEVGLDGSINAEQLGSRTISGPGGLPDYAFGGSRSAGGRSIIALPSANHKRGISRIVRRVANAQAPTLPASSVTHVVTEHGVAEFAGATSTQIAERLISIADPAHRQQLGDG